MKRKRREGIKKECSVQGQVITKLKRVKQRRKREKLEKRKEKKEQKRPHVHTKVMRKEVRF